MVLVLLATLLILFIVKERGPRPGAAGKSWSGKTKTLITAVRGSWLYVLVLATMIFLVLPTLIVIPMSFSDALPDSAGMNNVSRFSSISPRWNGAAQPRSR